MSFEKILEDKFPETNLLITRMKQERNNEHGLSISHILLTDVLKELGL